MSGQSVGRSILAICDNSFSSGESPLCIQKMLLSMIHAIGRQLKTSTNDFQIFTLYLRLPKKNWRTDKNKEYTRHRIHRVY